MTTLASAHQSHLGSLNDEDSQKCLPKLVKSAEMDNVVVADDPLGELTLTTTLEGKPDQAVSRWIKSKVHKLMFQLICDPSGVVVETTLKELVLAVIMWGNKLDHVKATKFFFPVTKLFQSKDMGLRRMVYLMINEISPSAYEVIIVTSSIMKDMNNKIDMYRANSILVLCRITDGTLLSQIERYLKQAIVDKNPVVASAALVSGIHLLQDADIKKNILFFVLMDCMNFRRRREIIVAWLIADCWPKRVAEKAVTLSIRQQFGQPWPTWGAIPKDHQELFFQRFREEFDARLSRVRSDVASSVGESQLTHLDPAEEQRLRSRCWVAAA
ncbi:hypothetical protein JHK87_016164 [Glycine soja]|nr:hypothetical protein JHK87_016164 [Glycine soja]